MKTREAVLRRRSLRKATFALGLAVVFVAESFVMGQVFRQCSRAPVVQQLTVDPGVCFQGW